MFLYFMGKTKQKPKKQAKPTPETSLFQELKKKGIKFLKLEFRTYILFCMLAEWEK